MPASSGEPFRGLARIQLADATGFRFYTLSVADVAPNVGPTNQDSDYKYAPGTAVTIRFEWTSVGAPGMGQADAGSLQMRLPGGAAVGVAQALAPTGDSGVQTFTVRFDDNPLDAVDGDNRWGMLEIFLEVRRTAAVAWGPADSRGTLTSPSAAQVNTWARGYFQIPGTIVADSLSNVALGGAEPATWAFPDPIHSRVTFSCAAYENFTKTRQLLRASTLAVEREETLAGSGTTRDMSWTGSTGTNRRVGDGMFMGSELKSLRAILAATAFGSDNKFIFAGTGHGSGWVRDSDLQMTRANRLTVDPRLTVFRHHFQLEDDVFGMTKHDTSKAMLATQSASLYAIIDNARGEGQNGIAVTQALTPRKPGVALSSNTTTATQDGRAGVSGRLDWVSSKPSGIWDKATTITAPADADEAGMLLASADTATLLAADPRIEVISGGGPTLKDYHARPGITFQAGAAILQRGTRVMLAADPDGAGGHKAYAALVRLQDTGANAGRAEYLALDGTTWVPVTAAGQAIVFHQLTQTRPDSCIYTKTWAGTLTAGWGDYDIFVMPEVYYDGTPYGDDYKEIVVGQGLAHRNIDFSA